MTSITTSPDLNCSVRHAGDSFGGFYADTACGTFLSVDGVLFGPATVPAGGGASPRTAWTPVSQTGPTGDGSASSPYVVKTLVAAGTTGVRVTQTDTYVTGQNHYRTDVEVHNDAASARSTRVWRAADCYLGDDDFGYGAVNSRAGTIGCRQGSRLVQWQPLTAGSHYYEDHYSAVWSRIGAQQAFPDTCARCTEYVDNGAGLSWDASVPAGGATTVSHRTNFTSTLPALDLAATFGPDCTCDSLGMLVNLQYRTPRPINTATGAESESFRDVGYPGPGVPLVFTRFYTSLDTSSGPFGVGWTFGFGAGLREDSVAGKVTVRSESGAQAVYTRLADGSYAPPPAVSSQLRRTADGWTLVAPDGHQLRFDASGRYASTVDRSGQGVHAAYTHGRLASLTDAAGRTVTLTWTGDRITRLALADGRQVLYGYESGRLTSVTDLRGEVTRLAYDGGGRLASVQEPTGSYRFRNTYDPVSGRVVEQLDPYGGRTVFTWDPVREVATRTDARGQTWTEHYAGNVLIEQSDPYGNAWLYDYDRQLRPTSITNPRGGTTSYAYNAIGEVADEIGPAPTHHTRHWEWDTSRRLLTSSRDRNGRTTSYTYTEAGLLASTAAPSGRTTRNTYTARGALETTTTARGKVWRYGYDADGNLTSVTSPTGSRTTYGYDAAGRTVSVTSPRGNVPGVDPAPHTTRSTYDGGDLLMTVADGLGGTTRYAYDGSGRRTSVTDARGGVVRYEYDAALRPSAVTNQLGAVTRLTYDAEGNLTAVRAPTGTTTYSYDRAGRLESVTGPRGNEVGADAAAHTWTYGHNASGLRVSASHPDPAGGPALVAYSDYDEFDRPVRSTDPAGRSASRSYDAEGRLTAVTDAAGHTARYGYDLDGRLDRAADRRGGTTLLGHDADGNRTRLVLPDGSTTTWEHDDDGRLAAAVDPRGNVAGADPAAHTTRYTYDPDGNVASVTDPLGAVTRHRYDALGRLGAVVDPLGGTTVHEHDALGRLVRVVDPLAKATAYAYDAAGRLTTRTDAKGHVTRYGYDAAGRLTGLTTPGARVYGYEYTTDGLLRRVVTARASAGGNGVIDVGVDSLGRRTSLDYSDATPDESFSYDRAGHLVRVVDASGTTVLGRDELGRLTSTDRGGLRTGFGYDVDGRVTRRTFADGRSSSSEYDVNGRLRSTVDATGTTTYTYDPAGRLLTSATPDGLTERRSWDAAGRLTGVRHERGGAAVADYTRTLDPLGRPAGVRSAVEGTVTDAAFTYDAAGRLLAECTGRTCDGSTARTDHAYDAVGNRTSSTATGGGSPGTTSYVFDQDDRLLQASRGTATAGYAYDENGNQLVAGAPGEEPLRLSFDLANRLTRVQRAATTGASPAGLLAGGGQHSLAVQSDGSLWSFGDNALGQLGLVGTSRTATPARVPGVPAVTAVAAGTGHSLALAGDGSVLAFGDNGHGQSGAPGGGSLGKPTAVRGVSGATAVTAGNYHSLAARSDGSVLGWGMNTAGQLGNGTTSGSSAPVAVQGLAGVTGVAAGGLPGWAGHSLARTADGSVWAWGYGKSGQLGRGTTSSSPTPAKVPGLAGVVAVAAGGDTSYALKSDGTVWAWGDNAYGQLGNPSAGRTASTPVQVQVSGVTALAAGGTHALARRNDGRVVAWGNNNSGQLGDGGVCGKTCAVPVAARSGDARSLGAGYVHSLTAVPDGTARSWGRGAEGQLGTGSTAPAATPQTVSGLTAVRPMPGAPALDTAYAYDASGLRARATTGATTTPYTWDVTSPVPTLMSDGTDNYAHDPLGNPSSASGSSSRFFHGDALGSVRLTTAADGATTARAGYDAFGRPTAGSGAPAPFGFTGQQTDASGLQYLRARYYDPGTGRFLSTDPVAPRIEDPFVASYVYVKGNPTTYTDPTGECFVLCAAVGAVVGGVAGGIGYAVTADEFSWGGLGAAAGKGAVVGGIVGATGGLGIAAGGSVAGSLGLGTAGTIAATAAGGAIGTTAGHWAVNTAMGEPYTGTDALIDVASGGLGGAFAGWRAVASGVSRSALASAAADECLPVAAARVQSLAPTSVRLSQSSVNGVTDIAESMRTQGWAGAPIDAVRMPDGGLTAIDNTRVIAAHQARIDVRANVHDFDDLLPPELVGRFTTPKGGAPSTWGEALLNRIGSQNSGYRNRYPYGSPFTGWAGG